MSKRGTKERHRAQEAYQRSEQTLRSARSAAEAPYRYFFASDPTAVSDTLGAQHEAAPGILQMLGMAISGEGALPYGINAPGVLEGLISRGREATDQRSQQAARQYQDLFPAIGGAAARGAADIYRRGASEAAQLETGLRAQAAENALLDRLRLLAGASGAFAAVNPMPATQAALSLPAQVSMALSGSQQNMGNMYQQQYRQKADQHFQAMQQLGGWIGQQLPTPMNMLQAIGGGGGGGAVGGGGGGAVGGGIRGSIPFIPF